MKAKVRKRPEEDNHNATNCHGEFMRLNTLSSATTEKIMTGQPQQQRAAALVACGMAIAQSSITQAVVTEALATLQAKEQVSDQVRAILGDLADELDQSYFDLMNEENSDSAAEAAALHLFSQARAITSLLYACKDDLPTSVIEAVYEASLSTDTPNQVIDAVSATF